MSVRFEIDLQTGQREMVVDQKGRALLINPFTNKGTGFTPRERTLLDLHGLVPPAVCSLEQQLERVYENFRSKPNDIEKYVFLTGLQDRNEVLFFRLVHEHIEEMMPIVYTPVVGEACQKFSHIYRRARGLYVSYDNRGCVAQVLRNYHADSPSIIVVTDGERILGLGDLGAGGMGISIGKLCLYTLCAGVSPFDTLPIMLDVGTNDEDRLADPLYLGLRQRRLRGTAYQDFVDEFVDAVISVYPDAVLQWEDFLKENAIRQLERYRERLCTFNDDIQGTAAVVLAGVLSGLGLTDQELDQQRVVIAGAGAAARGIADLFVAALVDKGIPHSLARNSIWMADSRGLVHEGREGLETFKLAYARTPVDGETPSLLDTIRLAKPTILIGTSGHAGLFDEKIVREMATLNERPMIFALSNPTANSECVPADALRWSSGRAIVATGSPFPPVEFDGKSVRIGQGNNSFIFPGVGLGLHYAKARRCPNTVFLAAAKALAHETSRSDLAEGSVYPRLQRIRECSHAVACAVVRQVVADGFADPEVLDDLEQRVRAKMWFPDYVPIRYEPGATRDRDPERRMFERYGREAGAHG